MNMKAQGFKERRAAVKAEAALEKIKSCMFMEYLCSNVFHLLALNFPKEKELWSELAMDEESHTAVIAAGMRLKPDVLVDFSVPDELERLKKTVEYAKEIKEKLINNELSFGNALLMVRTLHRLKDESYSRDLFAKEKEGRIRKVYKKLLEIDRHNLNIIQAVMDKYRYEVTAVK